MDQRLQRLLDTTLSLGPSLNERSLGDSLPSDVDRLWRGEFDELVYHRGLIRVREQQVVNRVAEDLRTIVEDLGEPVAGQGWQADDRSAAETALTRLLHPTIVDAVHSLDFILELRLQGDLLIRYRPLFAFLIAVQGEGWLDRENHGMGYHFHYLALRDRARTNVLLTFDPKETSPPDSLYWEHHGGNLKRAEPAKWGATRTRAVYDAAKPSLIKPGKHSFRPPSVSAQVLHTR